MATKKNTSKAVAAMVQTQTAKAAALVAKAEQKAAERIIADTLPRLHEAKEVQTAGERKADGMRAEAFNLAIDACRAAELDTGETKDVLIKGILRAAIDAGDLAEASFKVYKNGLEFAIERNVPWSTGLAGTEAKVEALRAAGKKIPADLQKQLDNLVAKRQEKRDAKAVTTLKASKEGIVKKLASALVDARALGLIQGGDILSAIHAIDPTFVEPTGDK